MAEVLWTTPTNNSDLITTGMDAITAGNTGTVGTEFDNETNLKRWALFELNMTFASAPTAGGTIDLFLNPQADGTNYVDAVAPLQLAMFICSFTVRNVTSAQRIVGRSFTEGGMICQIPPVKFKLLIVNNTDQTTPSTGTLGMLTSGENI